MQRRRLREMAGRAERSIDFIGRDLQEPPGLELARRRKKLLRAHHIRAHERRWIGDAAIHVRLGGEIHNRIGMKIADCFLHEWRNIDLVKTLLDVMGKPHSLIEFVKDRPGHDRRYAIDCSKSKKQLRWKPTVEFKRGLAETVEWYKTKRKWWELLKKK